MISEVGRHQLIIKGWVVFTLVLGLLVSVLVPKLAIARLGEDGYGVYALIIGFAGVLALSDLGLVPGLTKALAGPLAGQDRAVVDRVLTRVERVVLAMLLLLTPGCGLLLYWSIGKVDGSAMHALAVFAVATFYGVRAEIRAALVRAAGFVTDTYRIRALYLFSFLLLVLAMFLAIDSWSGVWLVCYAQLAAGLIYFLLLKGRLERALPRPRPDSAGKQAGLSASLWSEAWRVSAPERFNRLVQLVSAAVERPLLVATAGLALVGSYDLLLRLMLLVSAIPGALSQPLLAMLAHDSVRPPGARRFPVALGLTYAVGATSAALGLLVAAVLWTFFHEALFGVPSRIPQWVGLLVASVTAVNVLTAPWASALLAAGRVRLLNVKVLVEAVGVVVGAAAAGWLGSGLLFIVIRYAALGLAAVGFLLVMRLCRGRYGAQEG